MPLSDGQWQIRSLVMGEGTAYRLMDPTNPFDLSVRADQGGPRAWEHGSWSGAEWAAERVVLLNVLVRDEAASTVAGWREARHQLAAAFAPTGDVAEHVELRFVIGGVEYLLFGRPRLLEFETTNIGVGWSFTRAGFVAQDPRIYSGAEHAGGPAPLPMQVAGLPLPAILPVTIGGTVVGGELVLVNAGTAPAPLMARIDGPATDPRIILLRPDGSTQTVGFTLSLPAGQWLQVDSAAGTALLNGLETSSVFGSAAWDLDPYPLLPGSTAVRFRAADDEAGTLSTTHRDSWW